MKQSYRWSGPIVNFKYDWWRCLMSDILAYKRMKKWIWYMIRHKFNCFAFFNLSKCLSVCHSEVDMYRWFVEYALLEFLSFCCRNGQFWNGRQLLCRQPLCRSLCQRIPCGKPLFDWLEKFFKPLSVLIWFYSGCFNGVSGIGILFVDVGWHTQTT